MSLVTNPRNLICGPMQNINNVPVMVTGGVILRWTTGMDYNADDGNLEFQIRRNHVQPINSGAIWNSSELTFSHRAEAIDSQYPYSSSDGVDQFLLHYQSRAQMEGHQTEETQLDIGNYLLTGVFPSGFTYSLNG